MPRVCIVFMIALFAVISEMLASCDREEMRTRVGDGERDSVGEVVMVEEPWPEVEEVEVPWGVSEQ